MSAHKRTRVDIGNSLEGLEVEGEIGDNGLAKREEMGEGNVGKDDGSGANCKQAVPESEVSYANKEREDLLSGYTSIDDILEKHSYDHNEFCVNGSTELRTDHSKLFYISSDDGLQFIDLANCSEEEIKKLVDNCVLSPFGKGFQTIIDAEVRSAKEMAREKYSFQFSPHMDSGIIAGIDRLLRKRLFTIQPYKVNVYEKGDHFKKHRDTIKSKSMVASLVICVPTMFEGGILNVENERGITVSFDWGSQFKSCRDVSKRMEWVCFFSDCNHSISPIIEGNRITLTYDVHVVDATVNNGSEKEYIVKVQCHKKCIEELKLFIKKLDVTKKYGYHPTHVYDFFTTRLEGAPLRERLKGNDLVLYDVFHECGWMVQLHVYYPEIESYGPEAQFFDNNHPRDYECNMRSALRDGELERLSSLAELDFLNDDVRGNQQEIFEYEFVTGYCGNEAAVDVGYFYASTIMVISNGLPA